MADTEFSALSPTNTLAASDQIFVVRAGAAYRFTGGLPAVDASGNLLVGAASSSAWGNGHRISRAVAQGSVVLSIDSNQASYCGGFFAVGEAGYNEAGAALLVGRSGATGRSINAGGTVNASGADYAEYITKADGCGAIAAGDVCGVDADGRLTKKWADAVSFVIKSTDPAYVGGDSWAAHLPPRPDQEEGEAEPAFAKRLANWEVQLEDARQTVDRIAFCGQVPVNVSGEFAVGDYLIAAASGGGIKAIAVAEVDITFDQYRRRVGKVWAVRDGRAWVDVQHG